MMIADKGADLVLGKPALKAIIVLKEGVSRTGPSHPQPWRASHGNRLIGT
jgi:hypothetical protein